MKKLLISAAVCLPLMLAFSSCVSNISSSGKAGAQESRLAQMSVVDKISAVKALIQQQSPNAMDDVDQYFPDLMFVKKVLPTDAASISQKNEESWMYSITDDVTLVIDLSTQMPIALFPGKAISTEELAKLRK